MKRFNLAGLVAATHTPFKADGTLNLAIVERQVEHLTRQQIGTVFICGTTGESHSLTLDERRRLAQRWMEVVRGSKLKVIVHVGSNCLPEARELAAQAESLGALAIAALSPCYFKPRTVSDLVQWCVELASAAPATPFYFYDIPAFTGVSFPMRAFLDLARDRIPTLNGLKFTNTDLVSYQQCLADEAFDILWGLDESLLAALAVGAKGAVGSSYNFAASIYQRLLAAFTRGDLVTAQQEQRHSVQLIQLLARFDYLGAAKAVMKMLGVDVGPARPPIGNLGPEQVATLRVELERIGFFDWIEHREQPPG
jgi:N-acetylneuraminate lyase